MLKANDVNNSDIVVDSEGTVWVPCGGAEGQQRFWRYIADAADGALSWDSFETLPTQYEPYVQLDGPASCLIHRHLSAPKVQWSTKKR